MNSQLLDDLPPRTKPEIDPIFERFLPVSYICNPFPQISAILPFVLRLNPHFLPLNSLSWLHAETNLYYLQTQ